MTSLLPVPKQESKPEPVWKGRLRPHIINLVAEGKDVAPTLARLITKDPRRQKAWRQRIRTMLATDPEVQLAIHEMTHAQLVQDLPTITKRMGKRAKATGRQPEVKLAYEASGFHNPRVAHEHSGDITIKLDIPRPSRVENEEEIVDAEVVD
jgi:hypothetical protein